MRIFTQTVLVLLIIATSLISCVEKKDNKEPEKQRINIIFDTDMGNDVDDALALDMLYKYVDQERISLLGISTTKRSPHCAEYIDIMNTWYGYPDIPIGVVINGSDKADDDKFVRAVCEMEIDGKPAFARSINDYASLPSSVSLYRKILASQEDHSVDIISVGFSTNLAQLLDSPGDTYSPLTGKELVAKKVKSLSAMLGNFRDANFPEFNVNCDIPAAQKVVNEWPTPIVVSPFEVGESILYPASSIQNDFTWKEPNPMVEGYKAYLEMPYDRPTWDLTSVLYVVEHGKGFFDESVAGTVTINENGYSQFTPGEDGRHIYLKVNDSQIARSKEYLVDLISQKPLIYQE